MVIELNNEETVALIATLTLTEMVSIENVAMKEMLVALRPFRTRLLQACLRTRKQAKANS